MHVFSHFKFSIVLLKYFTTHSTFWKANLRHKRCETAKLPLWIHFYSQVKCHFIVLLKIIPPSICNIRKWKMEEPIKLNGLLERWSKRYTNDVLWEVSKMLCFLWFLYVLFFNQVSRDWNIFTDLIIRVWHPNGRRVASL